MNHNNFKSHMIYGVCGTLSFILVISSLLIFLTDSSIDNAISVEVDENLYSALFDVTKTSVSETESPKTTESSLPAVNNDYSFTEGELSLKENSPIFEPEVPLINNIESSIPFSNKSNNHTYHIIWGDTLSEIAYTYNFTVDELVHFNNIANPNLIYAGNELLFPEKSNHN